MASQKEIPLSAKNFIETGIEVVKCSICQEPYTVEHVAVEIKECGHQFGKHCLEEWLQQEDSSGTCPLCRNVLFRASKPAPIRQRSRRRGSGSFMPSPYEFDELEALIEFDPDEPELPDAFIEYYSQASNVSVSAQNGFLHKLWVEIAVSPPEDHGSSLMRAMTLALGWVTGPEYDVLLPYISRVLLVGIAESWSECPVISLCHTLKHITRCCRSDFTPSPATWHVIMLYQVHAVNDTFHWMDIRNAAWKLQRLHVEDRDGRELWRILHLFFFLMGIHRSQMCQHLPAYTLKEIRQLLNILACDDPSTVEARDTASRLFLAAAGYVLQLSTLDGGDLQDARCLRLISETTSDEQLKQDVVSLWVEAMDFGTHVIAAGFPESWWGAAA